MNWRRQRSGTVPAVGLSLLLVGTPGPPAAQPRAPLAYKGIALGMAKRDVCAQVMGMAFANEVACRTWQGDTLSPPRPDRFHDRLGQVPVITIAHFSRRDDPDARVDEIVLNFSHAAYAAVRATLAERREALDALAKLLMEMEVVDRKAFLQVLPAVAPA